MKACKTLPCQLKRQRTRQDSECSSFMFTQPQCSSAARRRELSLVRPGSCSLLSDWGKRGHGGYLQINSPTKRETGASQRKTGHCKQCKCDILQYLCSKDSFSLLPWLQGLHIYPGTLKPGEKAVSPSSPCSYLFSQAIKLRPLERQQECWVGPLSSSLKGRRLVFIPPLLFHVTWSGGTRRPP